MMELIHSFRTYYWYVGACHPSHLPTYLPTYLQRAIEADYAAICDIAPQLANVATLEEFKWARMCVCSRYVGR